ncbi:MAG: metallophosphoesterase [Planctomycetota bacterium]
MRVAFTSDLHTDSSVLNQEAVAELVRLARESRPDCLVVAGDVSADPEELERYLAAFAAVDVPRIFVPGNHDVWLHPRGDRAVPGNSTSKYDRLIARRARQAGFHPVWRSPAIVADTAFVGTDGWYDYSFAPETLRLGPADYARKEYGGLAWQDRHFARWKPRASDPSADECLSDTEVADMLNDDLRKLLARVSRRRAVSRIVAVTHHLPFRQMVRYHNNPRWDYFCAFMGNEKMGCLIESFDKVTHVLAGHTHVRMDLRVGRLRCLTSPLGYLARKREPLDEEIRKALTLIELDEP